jgi:hypothetical protein
MLYAILAYHTEGKVLALTAQQDATLMADLNKVHDRLIQQGKLGPAARLGATKRARTLRGSGDMMIERRPRSSAPTDCTAPVGRSMKLPPSLTVTRTVPSHTGPPSHARRDSCSR